MVAAILTIAGYSVNDTIVIFDRVRENMRLDAARAARQDREHQRQPDARADALTAGTTLFAVLALYLFGGEVLRGFAFAMLVGVITGTYSTVFIAAAIAIILSRREFSRPGRRRAGRQARRRPPRRRAAQARPQRARVLTAPPRPPAAVPRPVVPASRSAAHHAVTLLEAVLLGVIQGLTEFLPVSSSAHLILAKAFFGWDADRFGLAFDVACHLGTLLAVLVYFRHDLLRMTRAAPRVLSRAAGRAGAAWRG